MSQLLTSVKIYKNLGETPLEALERFRIEQISAAQTKDDPETASYWKTVPMTYAGRLDPMAEGELLILIGEECKNKEKYLSLDKEYEVEIVFGISTDSYDALGLAAIDSNYSEIDFNALDLNKYMGKFEQVYPPYSSKTVNGKQLHELARSNELPKEMPKREVEIYEIELIGTSKINAEKLKIRILNNIDLVKGNFRQKEIAERWKGGLKNSRRLFDVIRIKVKCSGGTYMRSLAQRIGSDLNCQSTALSIKRTKIVGPK